MSNVISFPSPKTRDTAEQKEVEYCYVPFSRLLILRAHYLDRKDMENFDRINEVICDAATHSGLTAIVPEDVFYDLLGLAKSRPKELREKVSKSDRRCGF